MVWVEHSSGDSFGCCTGRFADVGLYDTIEKAQFIKDLVLKQNKEYTKDPYSPSFGVSLKDADGLEVSTWPWTGYFERLKKVHIETMECL